MSNIKVSSLLLLASCAVLFLCSTPVASEETTIKNDEDVTLSTDLLPPPLPVDDEARGVIYFINLFSVKNKTDDVPDGKEENVLKDDSSEIIGRLASFIVLVGDDDDKADTPGSFWDKLTEASVAKDYEAFGEEMAKPLAVKVVSEITGEPKATEDKTEVEKKSRSKRTLFKKGCNTCNSGGGGGGYNNYGGGYPSGGGQPTVGVVLLPLTPVALGYENGGHGKGRRYHGGGENYQQPNHYQGGAIYNGYQGHGYEGNYQQPPHSQPVVVQYPNQGGSYYPVADGGGHGGSQAHASASASANAQSSTYGR